MLIRRAPLRVLSPLVLALLPLSAPAQDATVIATVGGNRVTTLDVEGRLAFSGGPRAGETLEQARERVANEILAELVIEQLFARTPEVNVELGSSIAQARRQIMLDYYIQSNLRRFAPTDEQIDAFIEANPRFFEGRASFWMNQILIALPEGTDREPLYDALETLRAGPIVPERILDFQRRLLEADLVFQRQSVWRSSEQLPAEALDRLEEMHAAGEQVDIIESARQMELLLLLQRVSDPADAQAQRRQIAQGLVLQDVQPQRDALIVGLANRARGDRPIEPLEPEAPAAPVVQRQVPSQPWMFGVVGGLGFTLPLVLWSGKGLAGAVSRRSAWRWPVVIGVVGVVLAGLAALGWVSRRLWPILGTETFAALMGGGLVMGALVASTWARSLAILDPSPGRAALRFSGLVLVQVLLFATYVAFRLGWV